MQLTESFFTAAGHSTAYLAAGPAAGPLIVFVHGWPELGLSWRHQLSCFAELGFRVVAPDMRGYGGSTVYPNHADYAQSLVVADMLRLLEHLGEQRAIWIGHDWGAATVWSLARHHPERCIALANLCVPYRTLERGLDACLNLINREIYPADQFPVGQWEYMRFYEENFDTATSAFDAAPDRIVKALFRKGEPKGYGKPTRTAFVRINNGWFRDGLPPDLAPDEDVVSQAECDIYADSLRRNGFFGPNSYYMNHRANAEYAEDTSNGAVLNLPVLFLAAQYDYTCDCITSRLPEAMRELCTDLTERVVYSGHWMAQERPADVNAALAHWLATAVGDVWPSSQPSA